MRNNKGITLIALVITIIVLLILAGVSIAMLTGDNGILTQAGNAKTETAQAEAEEAVKLAVNEILANSMDPSYEGDEDEINVGNLTTLIPKNNANVSITGTITDGDGYFTANLTVNKTAVTVYISDAGKVSTALTDITE